MDEALSNIMTTISSRLNAELTTPVTEWEVKLALFAIYPEKSLGPDGLTALFDQKNIGYRKGRLNPYGKLIPI